MNSKDHKPHSSSIGSSYDGDDKRHIDDKAAVNSKHGSMSISEKPEKQTRNKDRVDRGVWAPLHRPGRSQSNGISFSSEDAQQRGSSLESFSLQPQAVGKV